MISKNIDTIFFDLDGTLVNPKKRLYKLFIELSGSNIGYDEYWKYKKKGLNQVQMLELVGYEFQHQLFKKAWLEEVERQDLLSFDDVFDDVFSTLEFAKANSIRMIIVTNRQSYDNLMWELEKIGISDFFDEVITTYQKCSKDRAILSAEIDTTNAFFVGDSKEDMDAAAALGISGVLICRDSNIIGDNVATGFRITNLTELRGILCEK